MVTQDEREFVEEMLQIQEKYKDKVSLDLRLKMFMLASHKAAYHECKDFESSRNVINSMSDALLIYAIDKLRADEVREPTVHAIPTRSKPQ